MIHKDGGEHHRKMLLHYGAVLGVTCEACGHLAVTYTSKRYYKCTAMNYTNGPATDWKRKWQACGNVKLRIKLGERTDEAALARVAEGEVGR